MASFPMGVYRSTTCNASLWKFPDLSNHVASVKLDTSTTSVSPSHRPTEYPINASLGYGSILLRWIVRSAFAYSNTIMTFVALWMIWKGYGMYMARGTPGWKHLIS